MAKKKPKGEQKYFALVDKAGKDKGSVYHGRTARPCAMKAANDGVEDIRLRERGTDRVHVFKGGFRMVAVNVEKLPTWLQKSVQNGKLRQAHVKKTGVEHLKAKKKK